MAEFLLRGLFKIMRFFRGDDAPLRKLDLPTRDRFFYERILLHFTCAIAIRSLFRLAVLLVVGKVFINSLGQNAVWYRASVASAFTLYATLELITLYQRIKWARKDIILRALYGSKKTLIEPEKPMSHEWKTTVNW